jgi:hypothetical protein
MEFGKDLSTTWKYWRKLYVNGKSWLSYYVLCDTLENEIGIRGKYVRKYVESSSKTFKKSLES